MVLRVKESILVCIQGQGRDNIFGRYVKIGLLLQMLERTLRRKLYCIALPKRPAKLNSPVSISGHSVAPFEVTRDQKCRSFNHKAA